MISLPGRLPAFRGFLFTCLLNFGKGCDKIKKTKGAEFMSNAMKTMIDRERAEAETAVAMRVAANLWRNGYALADIARIVELPLEKVQESVQRATP